MKLQNAIALFFLVGWGLKDASSAMQFAPAYPVKHIVLVDLKPDVSDEQIDALFQIGESQLQQIPGVVEVEFGSLGARSLAPYEGAGSHRRKAADDRPVHIGNYDIALYLELESLDDLAVYQNHPLHREFVETHQNMWDTISVIDFYGSAIAPSPTP